MMRSPRLELCDWRMVEVIARESSLTRAADQLCLSQSALSRRLINLEQSVGVRLFDRVGKRMRATQVGEALAAAAPAILAQCREAERSIEAAASNAERNRVNERNGGKLTTVRGDAFDVLQDLAKQRARFDIVVIDPPAFAKRKKDLPKALAAYKRLNQLAMQVIADDGILVSCSCSYHVSPEDLQDAIAKAAKAADRHLQILEIGGQAPDHPVHPAIPETRYLKAYFCRVSESLK